MSGGCKRDVTYVSKLLDRPAHDDDLLRAQEGVRIRGRGPREVGGGPQRHDGDGVGLGVAEQLEHLLVSRDRGGAEEVVGLLGGRCGLGRCRE
jgi:hypothetical protein